MRKSALVLSLCLAAAFPAAAQKTTVTATIVDPNGVPYANGSVSAQLAPAGVSNPTVGGAAIGGTVGPAATDANGRFSMDLFSNTSISPGGTQWQFTVCNPGVQPPLGFGNQCFTPAAITITGATQDVSTQLNAVAPVLTRIAGVLTFAGAPTGTCGAAQIAVDTTTGNLYTCKSGAWQAVGGNPLTPTSALPQQAHLIGAYWMLPSENPCAFKDYSGRGNDAQGCPGPNTPVIVAGTGGVSCVWNGTPITLPSALNAAQTIIIFTAKATGTINTWQSPIAGNGNGAQGHFISITYSRNNAGVGSTGYNLGQTITALGDTTGTGVLGYLTNASPGAPAVIALTNGGGNFPAMYLNGLPISGPTAAQIMADQDRGNFQLCGTAAGKGFSQTAFYNGYLGPAFLWDTALTSTEIAAASNLINGTMAARGYDLNECQDASFSTSVGCEGHNLPILNVEGDSIFQGSPFGNSLALTNINGTVSKVNNALVAQGLCSPGSAGLGYNARFANSRITSSIVPGNMEMVWLGTDDNGSPTGIALNGCLALWAAESHKTGQAFVPITMLDRSTPAGEEARKNAYNTSIRQNANLYDTVADVAAWAVMGADGAAANTTYFSDGVHPTFYAAYNFEAPIIQSAYNHVFGSKDFNTAATYSSAAAAATATTAGSESTNTVTITFGATPANCQVGNFITIAGATPAGYNGTFWILTRTATQITYFNSVTGLGAISVQGTGQCPTQQDNDNFAILNFGAGNFNLLPCEVWVGGSGAPDRKVHITNINAASSTIGTWNSQTINGASTLTLAAHASVTLSANLVSSAAAGCYWTTQ